MKECLQCKKEFETSKPQAKFCCVTCRVNFFRSKKRVLQELMKLDKPLEDILEFAFGKDAAKVVMGKIESNFSVKSAKVIKDGNKHIGQFDVEYSETTPESYDAAKVVEPEGLKGINLLIWRDEQREKNKSEK